MTTRQAEALARADMFISLADRIKALEDRVGQLGQLEQLAYLVGVLRGQVEALQERVDAMEKRA